MMIDLVESLKEKYAEETGWSFSFFEVVAFSLYLFFVSFLFENGAGGAWHQFLTSGLHDLAVGDSSIFKKASTLEYIISLMSLLITITVYRYLQSKIYDFLSTLRDMSGYVARLNKKYGDVEKSGQAMKIYIAKEAANDKKKYMRQVSMLSGLGLLSIAGLIATTPFLFVLDLVNYFSAITCVLIFLAAQWFAFVKYTSQVLPRLILEKKARGEAVKFGEGLRE
ncbi:hypothetical protein SAMN05660443_0581 [Marinospirillum celere]|uniref:Uncharacterized protein n=1 Tax=Marinospirillum celere TaxID=1122252 RepID=A0A1I1EG24_9GAMM|nr:hypothetical protein [Marinospirillum celere]SFB85977.1 hypothetical protein SAMN05660443_0581 [Marinospirillum celere]